MDFFKLIPELGNFPFLSLIYWFVKFALIAFSEFYYFMWANAQLVSGYFSNYNLFTIIDIIKEGFNFWYEQGYMILCSMFPDKIPSLPGKNPLSLGMAIVYILRLFIIYKLLDNVLLLVYYIYKYLCFKILAYFPDFIINHLFYFNKKVQNIWIPFLKLKKTDKLYLNKLSYYFNIRRGVMSRYIKLIIKCIIIIILCILVLTIFNDRLVWEPVSTPNPEFKNKPTEGGIGFLFPFLLFNNNITYEYIMLNMGISLTQVDPFIFNMCSFYVKCCQVSCYFAVLTIGLGLCGMFSYIYTYKFQFLKPFLDNKKNLKWAFRVVVMATLSYFFSVYINAIFTSISQAISIINSKNIHNFYYDSPGLAMGKSRVLHIAEYSWPLDYLSRVLGFDLNPEYIIYFISFIKGVYQLTIAVIWYMFIACFTTGIYSRDKMALSLPGGPGTLNLFTKCFYLKKPYKVIFITLVIITLMLILVSYLLFVYINIYVKG